MPPGSTIIPRFEKLLQRDETLRPCPRLIDDAQRLWKRCQKFINMGLVKSNTDQHVIELACWALQLPLRDPESIPTGKFGRNNLRERSEQAAELLVSQFGEVLDEKILDKTTRLLLESSQKSPKTEDARLLADVINLDDFGLTGLINTCISTASQGLGLSTLLEGAEKRDAYGYWEARLRDGFHFPQVRAIAESRLHQTRKVIEQLLTETHQDRPDA